MWWRLQSSTTLADEVSAGDTSTGLRALIWLLPLVVLAAVAVVIVVCVQRVDERR
jgi:cytochrome c-type biogenesis protein CcmH/NrfF